VLTLGDIIHSARSFLTLQRGGLATRPFGRAKGEAPEQLRGLGNPVTRDVPPGGQYQDWRLWQDERTARLALATGWSYAAINKIGMASLPSFLNIKRRVGEETEDIPNHPLELLVQTPNPDMSREYLWLHTIYSLYMRAAYWFLYPDLHGNIGEIWPMPFNRVRPLPDMSSNPERLFAGFIYTFQGGQEIPIPVDNVIYLRFPDPFDLYASLPPLRAATRPVVLDNAQSDWNTNLFDQEKGLPASIVSVPAELSNEQFNRVKAELRENVGKRMVTRAGTIDVEFAQETHQEMEFLAGREFNRKEIYETLGVPLETDKESWRWFLDNTVWPVLTMLAGQLTTQLVRPYFGENVFAEFEDIRPQDRSLEVQEAVQYWPSYSLNETREQRGMKPLPALKIEAEGFEGLDLWSDIPTRILDQVVGLVVKIPGTAAVPGFAAPPSMPGSAGAKHAQVQEDSEAAGVEDVIEETEPAPEDTAEVKAVRAALGAWQKIAIKQVKSGRSPHVYFDDSIPESTSYELAALLGHCRNEAEVKAVFEHLVIVGDSATKATLSAARTPGEIPEIQLKLEEKFAGPMQNWLSEQARRISQAVGPNGEPPPASFWAEETKLLDGFLDPFVNRWGEEGISETVVGLAKSRLGLDAQVNARVAEWAGKHALKLAKKLDETTKELARPKIKQWLLTGKPLPALEKDLAEVIAPAWRASLIASTEVTRAFAEVNLEIAGELDVIKGVTWLTANDELVCPICGPLNGATRPKKPGATFPGGFDAPPAHPRCRCGLSFSL
jgi:hypothetical protein